MTSSSWGPDHQNDHGEKEVVFDQDFQDLSLELCALRMAFVCGICCPGNMVSSRKYSVYLSTLDTPRCNMCYIGLSVFFPYIPRRGNHKSERCEYTG